MLRKSSRQLCLATALQDRQLYASAVHCRPFVADFQCEGECSGAVLNNPGGLGSPAFAMSYSKVYNKGKFLAIADEEGFVTILDTSQQLPRETAEQWRAVEEDDGQPRARAQWLAHKNAIFDVAWIKGDTRMLTGSGDQAVALWDTATANYLGCFRGVQGHMGSVKSVCAQPSCQDVFASGARDGALAVWDARAAPTGPQGEHHPIIKIRDAHALADTRPRRTPDWGRTKSSVTSVRFLREETMLASAGVDGTVRFWDLRHTREAASEVEPHLHLQRAGDAAMPRLGHKQSGVTSLDLHPDGAQLLVSLTGGHNLIYDCLRPEIGPTKWFGGHTVTSFYIKACFSPDGAFIASGSNDRLVYVWQVEGRDGAAPVALPGHEGEVTALAWCSSDFGQLASTADDSTLRVWNIQRTRQEAEHNEKTPARGWQGMRSETRQPNGVSPLQEVADSQGFRRREELASIAIDAPGLASEGRSGRPGQRRRTENQHANDAHYCEGGEQQEPLRGGHGGSMRDQEQRPAAEAWVRNGTQGQQQQQAVPSGQYAASPAQAGPSGAPARSPATPWTASAAPGSAAFGDNTTLAELQRRGFSTGARPTGRSIGSVLREAAAATQTQRRTRQQSIASFLASRPSASTDRDPAAPSASKRMRVSFDLGSGERHRAAAAHPSQLEPSPEGQAGVAAAAAAQEPSSCQSGQPESAQ